MKFAAAWLCHVKYCIYINGWDLLRQPSSGEYGWSKAAEIHRPVDISWLLYKVPTPRGIYIPRLLSIIRHLPSPPPPHSFTQTPQSCRRKILISVLMTWQRAIQIGIPRRGWGVERVRGWDIKVQKIIREMYFCPCLRIFDNADDPASGWYESSTTSFISFFLSRLFFFFATCVCLRWYWDKASGQIWWVSTPPESLLSSAAPPKKESTCVRNPLMCCSVTYQSARGEEQLERRRLGYHNSSEQEVKQECVRRE